MLQLHKRERGFSTDSSACKNKRESRPKQTRWVSFLSFFFLTFCGSRLRHLGAKFCIVPPQSDTRNLSNAADAHVTGWEVLILARHRLPLLPLLLCRSLRERKHQVHIGMHRLFDSCLSAEFHRGRRGTTIGRRGKIQNHKRV